MNMNDWINTDEDGHGGIGDELKTFEDMMQQDVKSFLDRGGKDL